MRRFVEELNYTFTFSRRASLASFDDMIIKHARFDADTTNSARTRARARVGFTFSA